MNKSIRLTYPNHVVQVHGFVAMVLDLDTFAQTPFIHMITDAP